MDATILPDLRFSSAISLIGQSSLQCYIFYPPSPVIISSDQTNKMLFCLKSTYCVIVLCLVPFVSDYKEESSAQAADQPTLSQNVIVVGFYLGDEAIPYRTTIQGPSVTLGRFKQLISKRGSYRLL